MEAGPVDGMTDKINLETTSNDKETKSDEERKGLIKTLFKQGKKIFTSLHRGEGAVTSPEGTEETVLVDAAREFLAQDETQLIERVIKLGLKDVEDFDESKGTSSSSAFYCHSKQISGPPL